MPHKKRRRRQTVKKIPRQTLIGGVARAMDEQRSDPDELLKIAASRYVRET